MTAFIFGKQVTNANHFSVITCSYIYACFTINQIYSSVYHVVDGIGIWYGITL